MQRERNEYTMRCIREYDIHTQSLPVTPISVRNLSVQREKKNDTISTRSEREKERV